MAEDFISKFNRLLGDRAGITATQPIMPVNTNLQGAAEMRGRTKKKVSTAKRYSQKKKPSAGVKPKLTDEQKMTMQLLKDYQERAATEEAISHVFDNKNPLAAIGSGLGRGLDVLLRPSYAANEVVRNVSESVNAGEPIWSVGDDIVSGAISGLAGTRKTTGGDVVEENSKRLPGTTWASKIPGLNLGEGMEALKQTSYSGEAKWAKRVGGLEMDLVNDPYNLIGGSATTILKTGVEATEAGARSLVEEAAKKAANKFLPSGSNIVNVPGVDGLGNRFVRGADKIAEDASDSIAKKILEIHGGAQGGKTKFGAKTLVPSVTNDTAESFRVVRLNAFERKLQKFAGHIEGTARLTEAQIKTLLKDVEFKGFHDELIRRANLGRPRNPIKNWAELEVALRGYEPTHLSQFLKGAAEYSRSLIGDEVKGFMDDFAAQISKISYNAPGIRIAGKNIPFKRVGKAYADLADRSTAHISGDTLRKFSYEKQFPGRLSLISQKTKSMGVRDYDRLQKETEKMAKGVSHSQRKLISSALDNGVQMSDASLEAARQWIRTQYDKILDEEVAMGVRPLSDRVDDYQFVFNKRGSKAARDEFKANRRNVAKTTGSVKGYTAFDAAAKGLKPVDDPFEALLYRKMDSNRSMTRAWFKKDLLEHYGLMAKKLSDKEVRDRALVLKKKTNLPVDIQNQMNAVDEWYLPREVDNVYKAFIDLTTLGSKDGATLGRIFDNLTNKFKFLATVPFPGFHIRNMIGDVFMGFLDGVRSSTYSELFNKIQKTRAGSLTRFHIGEGLDLTYDELNDLYMRHAASGRFYTSDLDPRMIRSAPKKVIDFTRDVSERREDFGRLAHFLHAMRDEYPAAVRAGKKGALDKAVEASVYRVNKYKFDYSALTATEQKIKRVGMPFYTYSRKAIPTLMEAMFLSPRNIGRAARIFGGNQGSGYENFNHMLVPEYMREIGYATLSDEDEPWAVSGDILPVPGALTKLDFSDRQDFFQSVVSQMNPIIGAVPELAMGKYAFNDRPIGSTPEYLMSKIAPFGALDQWQNENMSIPERLLANRLGLGLSARKITTGQQEFAYQDLRDQVIDTPFREFNMANEDTGIRIYSSNRQDGFDYQVKDTQTDLVVFTSKDPREALKFAEMAAKGMREGREPIPQAPEFNRRLMESLQLG